MSRRGVVVDASYCGAVVAFVVVSAAVIAHNAFAHRWTTSFAASVVLPSSLALLERWWLLSTDDVVRRRVVLRAALALSCAGPGWVAAAAVACGDGRSDVVPWSHGGVDDDDDAGATEPPKTTETTTEGWPPRARTWYESATSNDGYEDELGGPTCARLGDALFFAGSDGADDGRRRLFAQSLAETTTTTPRSFGTFVDPTGLTVVSSTARGDGRRWLCFFDASRALWCGDDGRDPRSFRSATLPAAARSAARPTAIEGELWWRGADDAAYSYRPDARESVVRRTAGSSSSSGRLSCRARDRWACATCLVACALPVALVGLRGRRGPSSGVVGLVAAAVATTAIAGVVEPHRAPDAWFLVWDVGAPLTVAASTVASLSRGARDRRDADAGWWWTLALGAVVVSARAVVAVAVGLEDLRRYGRYDVGDSARDAGRAAVVAIGVGAALSVVGRLVGSALVSFLGTAVVGSFVAHAAVAVSWRALARAGASSATRDVVVAVVVTAAASALAAWTRRRRDDPRWRDAAIALWDRWTDESGARYDPDAVERLVPTEDDDEDNDEDDECSTAPAVEATSPTSSVELT